MTNRKKQRWFVVRYSDGRFCKAASVMEGVACGLVALTLLYMWGLAKVRAAGSNGSAEEQVIVGWLLTAAPAAAALWLGARADRSSARSEVLLSGMSDYFERTLPSELEARLQALEGKRRPQDRSAEKSHTEQNAEYGEQVVVEPEPEQVRDEERPGDSEAAGGGTPGDHSDHLSLNRVEDTASPRSARLYGMG